MHDAERVRLGERVAGLQHQVDRERAVESSLGRSSMLAEIDALEELHDHVRPAVLERADVADPRDVLALELHRCLGLANKPGDVVFVDLDVVAQAA